MTVIEQAHSRSALACGARSALERALVVPELLPECLREFAKSGLRVPDEVVPRLLRKVAPAIRGRQFDWAELEPVLGSEGLRLTAESPEWRKLMSLASESADAGATEGGGYAQPEAEYSDQDVQGFVDERGNWRGPKDEALLERSLHHGDERVRDAASHELLDFPGSRYMARLREYAISSLSRAAGEGVQLKVAWPPDDFKQLERQLAFKGLHDYHLILLIGLVPLDQWTESLKASPSELIRAAIQATHGRFILSGWIRAVTFPETASGDWLAPLIDADRQMGSVLAEASRVDLMISGLDSPLRGSVLKALDEWSELASVSWVLDEGTELAEDAAFYVLRALTRWMSRPAHRLTYEDANAAERLSLLLPSAALEELSHAVGRYPDLPFRSLRRLIDHRKAMLEDLRHS